MKSTKLIATALVAGMLVTGCGIGPGKAIIKINDTAITQGEFNKAMDKQISMSPFAKMGGEVKNNKEGMLYLMTEKVVLNQLIYKKIMDAEIKNRGIKISDDEVNKAIDKIVDKLGSKDQLSKLLKQNGISVKDFKADIANQVRLQKLARLSADTSVSDAEVKAFYDNNKNLFVHNDKVRAYHILIPTDRAQLEGDIRSASKKDIPYEEVKRKVDKLYSDNKKLAEKIAKELKADSSKFESYAKKYSKDEFSGQRGGDLGYFEKGQMVPEFSKAAFEAKPNTVVGPVQSPYGLHIIMVTDRVAAGTDSFEKVKSDIKDRLQTQKELKVLDDIINAAKKKAKIVYANDNYNPDVVEQKLQKQMKGLQDAVVEQTKKK